MAHKLLFVTGVSSGLGASMATAALDAGWHVVGTVRDVKTAAAFEALRPGAAFSRVLDVTQTSRIVEVVEDIEASVGPITALVNNAGFGMIGPLEECSMEDIRLQFEVNVFGAIAVLQAVLPFMRKRRAGRILNITSMGGIVTIPGVSAYHGSKFALEGISEALGKEVREFGILVTAVEPGMFRTDWYGRSQRKAAHSIPDYDAFWEARGKRILDIRGDPAKAARAMLAILEDPNPPAHLPLGPDAVRLIGAKLQLVRDEMEVHRVTAEATDFD